MLKIFLGMLSDRVNLFGFGHRKPYIVLGLLVQTTALIFVPLVNPGTQFIAFTALAFIALLGMALYDTCTDGLALDLTHAGRSAGRGNGVDPKTIREWRSSARVSEAVSRPASR